MAFGMMLVLARCGDDPGTPDGSDGLDGQTIDSSASPDANADSGPTTCAPNATQTCSCVKGTGVARCLPDGSGMLPCECLSFGAEIYVSTTGNDSGAGTLGDPYKTLAKAQSAARVLVAAGLPAGGIVVWLRGGSYPMTQTLALGAADSGTASAGVTFSGYPGESAHLVGGTAIDPTAFVPVTSASPVWGRLDPSVQGQVVVANVKALGLTDYGTIVSSGNDCSTGNKTSPLELTIDGAEMQLARWPDATENTDVVPDVNGASVHVYGSGLSPDVSGDYTKTGTADGVSLFTRNGLVGGKQYNLHRTSGTSNQNQAYTAWFITTTPTGYPSASDPFFYEYSPALVGMDGAQGATGAPSFRDPAAIHDGFSLIAQGVSATKFEYSGARPARWSQAPDAWVHGLFQYGWAECHTKVTAVDTVASTITVATAPGYGIASGRPFYAENLLEEITTPGEWYLDRASGLLYLLPPSALAGKSIVVSTLGSPILSFSGASYITVRDLFFENGRADLIEASGGSAHLRLTGLTLRNGGQAGASLNGTDIGVSYAHVYGTATDGVIISGGSRPSLTRV